MSSYNSLKLLLSSSNLRVLDGCKAQGKGVGKAGTEDASLIEAVN